MRPVDLGAQPELELLATLQGTWLRVGAAGPWSHLRSPRDATGLVTAFALPLLGAGALAGFDLADLSVLLSAGGAEFENLPWRWTPPLERHLAHQLKGASGAFAVFLGEPLQLHEVEDRARRLHAVLPPHAHCIHAASLLPGHPARLLLTLFRGGHP